MRTRRLRRTLSPAELAWAAALPCALATVAAIMLLGPPLGRAVLAPHGERFWPHLWVRPEPVEHARYLLAVLGVPLLAGTVALSARRRIALPEAAIRWTVRGSQIALAAVLVLCVLAQHDIVLRAHVYPATADQIFTWWTLGAAAVLTPVLLTVVRSERVQGWVRRAPESPSTRRWCLLLAIATTVLWLSTAINSDATIAGFPSRHLVAWEATETFAVLDGRNPLVDFHAQYAHLWPYLVAGVMSLLGSATLTTWTLTMTAISGGAMLAIFAVFRRVARRSALALALYVPFLAMSFFVYTRALTERLSPAGIFSLWPLRMAGPYLLAWLAARHVDGLAPRRTWVLMTAAGLVVLNNLEFGIGAFAATLGALIWARPPRTAGGWARLAGTTAAGVAIAAGLVGVLTLIRSGQLPHFGLLFEFPRIYGLGGWVLERMSVMGLHVALYATFAAAVAVATVRALCPGQDPVLRAMLAWSGIFGLVAGGYFAGRSDALNLISLFSPWYLALALLTIVVVEEQSRSERRRVGLGTLAVLLAAAVAVCALPQVPLPWSQVARLEHVKRSRPFEQRAAKDFVARETVDRERVVILIWLGHRIAYDLGLIDVAPYASAEAMPTREQLDATVAVARREGVRSVFVDHRMAREAVTALSEDGLSLRAIDGDFVAFDVR
jgi:hypothetical protein